MIDFGMLFDLGKKAVDLGVSGWAYWKKANATIDNVTGKVDPSAYADLVAEIDTLISDIQRAAAEARAQP